MSGEASKTKRELIAEIDALRRELAGHEALGHPAAPSPLALSMVAYHRLLESAEAIVMEVDESGSITHVTPSVQPILGYTPEEVIHQRSREWVHEGDWAHLMERFAKVFASGDSEAVSCRLRHKDGRWRLFEIVATPYRDAEGRPKVITQLRDVTAASAMDLSLRATRERHRLVDEMSRDVVLIIMNSSGELIWANSGLENLMGYTADDFETPEDFSERLHPNDRERVDAIFYGGLNEVGDTTSYEPYRFRHKDGSYGWYEGGDRIYQTTEGELQILSVMRDVSKTHRALQDLHRSEERYRMLAELNHDVILLQSDEEGRLLWANPGLHKLLGYTTEDFAQQDSWWSITHPEDRDIPRAAYEAGYQKVGHMIGYPVARVMHKDGSWRWIQSVDMLCENDSGERWMMSVMRDVTDQLQVEEDHRKLSEQLNESQRLESLGVMAGGIAHDFNNLLTPIVGQTSLALGDLHPESALRSPLLKIQKAAHRAAALTQQMLAYSGQGHLLIEPVNLSLLVEEMGELLVSNVSGGAVLSYSLTRDLPTVEGDSSQLSQIVMNLISNAMESVEEGSGHIDIRTGMMDASDLDRDNVVGKGELGSGPYVFLEVTDDGCGMDSKTRLKIFDPFFTTKFTGRGLGLASVVGIVQAHKGLIVLHSEVGQGTRFQVLLPAWQQAPTQQGAAPARPAWRSDGTVLIVDDDEGVRELAESTFRNAGLQVLVARDGREGLELFRRHADEIQAVVLDRTMPNVGGDTVFEEIRRLQPSAAVVLISGYSQDRAMDHIDKSLDAFLQKPFEPNDLLDIVRRVVEARAKAPK